MTRLSLAAIDGTSDRELARAALTLLVNLSPGGRLAIRAIVEHGNEWEQADAWRQISHAAESALSEIAQARADRYG